MSSAKRLPSTLEELQRDSEIQEMTMRLESQKNLEAVRPFVTDVLSLVVVTPEFTQLFLVQSADDLSSFVFTHRSDRIIVVDLLARCPREQVANLETYKFSSHPEFEKRISQYTRTAEKPNNQLAKCRPWDVALCLLLKIEALDSDVMHLPQNRLLFREYSIMKHLWDYFMRENMELDEMTGIPIVFKYEELPNPTYNYDAAEYKWYDIHGNLTPWKSETRSTLSYLCIEQLGPNLNYLIDVMVGSKKRGCVLDFDTSFKIFDQLLCRCLQVHRFGVIHNAIEPHNLYFGRSIAFNVLYLANFNMATVFDPKDTNNFHKSGGDAVFHGDLRFASHMRLRNAQPHPVHDLESAFYTLIVMLTNNLPWDSCLNSSDTAIKGATSTRNSVDAHNASNAADDAKANERNSMLQKLRESKTSFWKSPNGIARVLADLQFLGVGPDRARVPLALEIIKDLYGKIRDLLSTVGSEAPTANFFTNLLVQHTNEFQMYTDVRRTTLMMFRFESISAFINTPTYQKKIESLAHDEVDGTVRYAWNLTNWCFNSVEVSVIPSGTISAARSVARNAPKF